VEIQDTEAETLTGSVLPESKKPWQLQKRYAGLRPFVKGDPRRHKGGRPKSFLELRKLIQSIMAEEIEYKPRKNGKTLRVTCAEAMVRHAVKSKDPALMRLAFEYGFGKVPDKLEATGLENKTHLVLHFAHERAAVEAAQANGEDPRRALLRDAD